MSFTIQTSEVVFRAVLEHQLRKLFVHYEMGNNFKNIRAVVKIIWCTSRPNLSEDARQKYWESIQVT